MKKILLATQNQNDMTSFLRTWGIFTHPSMKNDVQPIRYPKDPHWVFDWTYFLEVDCVYLHRPGSTPAMDVRVIDMCKKWKIPLWVDLDDDLENITPDNPVYSNYISPEVKEVIRIAILGADILTCGGELHYSRLKSEYQREVTLIPNAIDDRLLHLKNPFNRGSTNIAWRGSESHRTDLAFFQDEIAECMENGNWTFFGLYPYQFEWMSKRPFKWTPKLNLMEYYQALTSYNAFLHIVPLADTIFNRVKSNLCWSDATLAGSIVLGPEFQEYQRPGVWHYKNNEDFKKQFKKIMGSSFRELEKDHNESWEWICDNILVSKVNKIRLEIVRNL